MLFKLQYIAAKFGWMVLTLLAITAITFAIFYIFPEANISQTCGKPCTLERYNSTMELMQLNKPIFLQFWDFLQGIFLGRTYGGGESELAAIRCDAPCLGYSFQLNKPISALIAARLPVTLSIAILAAVLWLILGIGLGVISALKLNKWPDRLVQGFSVLSISAPIYLLGLLAIALFGFALKIFPTAGYIPLETNPGGWLQHLILPCILLAISHAAIYIKLTRSGLLEAFASDYYSTFTALGVPKRTLFFKYGLRTSLLPLVTVFGLNFGGILSGAVITERVFSMPGLGTLLIDGAISHDIPIIVASVIVSSVFILISNFAVDAVYVLLDPRIKGGRFA